MCINRKELENQTAAWFDDEISGATYSEYANRYLERIHYKLYKYQGIGNTLEDYIRLLNHLKSNTMSLSIPSAFNDPFDCQFSVPNEFNETDAFKMRWASDCLFHVGCLTEVNDNRLMWAHYGDSHRGVCIEYDFASYCDKAPYIFRPVIYTSERPSLPNESVQAIKGCSEEIRLSEETKSAMTKALVTKDNVWAYEQEWCLIYSAKKDKKYIDLDMPPITAIYLGAYWNSHCLEKAECEKLAKIKTDLQDICNQKGIRFVPMMLDGRSYDVKPANS